MHAMKYPIIFCACVNCASTGNLLSGWATMWSAGQISIWCLSVRICAQCLWGTYFLLWRPLTNCTVHTTVHWYASLSLFQLYGGAVANLLLSALGRLFTSFLQLHGFTLGVEDILVLAGADEERRRAMEECKECGPQAAAEAFNITGSHDTG